MATWDPNVAAGDCQQLMKHAAEWPITHCLCALRALGTPCPCPTVSPTPGGPEKGHNPCPRELSATHTVQGLVCP